MFHVKHFGYHVKPNKRYTKPLIKCSVFYWPMLDFAIFKNHAFALPNYGANVLNELSKMLCMAFFDP